MPVPRAQPAWRLPAVIIGAGALLALLSIGLALRSKALLKDAVLHGCAVHAGGISSSVRQALEQRQGEVAPERPRPHGVRTIWFLGEAEPVGRVPEDAPAPSPEFLRPALAHAEGTPLQISLPGDPPQAATWLPAQRALLLWDLQVLKREVLAPLVREGDERYQADLLSGEEGLDDLPFRARLSPSLAPPLSFWRVAVGIADPSAMRTSLRVQTGLLGALATWLLVVLIGGVLLSVRRERRSADDRLRREQFLERAYHELQTPLALLRAAAESIQRGAVSEPGDLERCLQIVAREEERLTQGIRRLLRYLRWQGPAPSDELVPLKTEVEGVIEEQRGSLEAQGLQLTVALEGLQERLGVPRDLVGDVLRELLSNAGKHAAGASRVSVTWRALGAKRIELCVEDDGQSSQADPLAAASPNPRGGSLGLILVKEAMGALGGSVSFANTGAGARFRLEVPCTWLT